MAKTKYPQPKPNQVWINPDGTPSQIFYLYSQALDTLIANGVLGPLTNAVSDAAAAAQGVPINGFYRSGNAVQVRLS